MIQCESPEHKHEMTSEKRDIFGKSRVGTGRIYSRYEKRHRGKLPFHATTRKESFARIAEGRNEADASENPGREHALRKMIRYNRKDA